MRTHGLGRTPQRCQLVPSVTRGRVACDLFLIWAIVNRESVKRDLCWVFQRSNTQPYSVLRGSPHDGPTSTTSVCSWGHVAVCPLGRVTSLGAQDALMGRLPGLHPVPSAPHSSRAWHPLAPAFHSSRVCPLGA